MHPCVRRSGREGVHGLVAGYGETKPVTGLGPIAPPGIVTRAGAPGTAGPARQRRPGVLAEAGRRLYWAMAAPSPVAGRNGKLRQRLTFFGLIMAVITLDQATKWWAWRHAPGAKINPGGDFLVGHTIGRWYANPLAGGLLDLLDTGFLSIAIAVLVRRRRSAAITVPGALVIGGWGSNLLDRLVMHYLTAPGSVRGAVDFIHVGRINCNLADFFILGATPVFLAALGYLGRRTANQPAADRAVPSAPAPCTRLPLRASLSAAVSAGLIVVVALGAAHYGGVRTAPAHTSVKVDRHVHSLVAG